MSSPGNGQYFDIGESGTVTITLEDNYGRPLALDNFAILNLYLYGPQETTKTKTAVKMLNASTDRSGSPHHYIDLLHNTDVQVNGNVLTYDLQPVSDEEPGTYTASVWAVKAGEGINQSFPLVDFQLGTATLESEIVIRENCASCHQGAQNGQFYMHHVDPGFLPSGIPSIDSWPVRTCKSCHNNDGYASYIDPVTSERVPDNIVFRVHGLHNGAHLETEHSADLFADYLDVVFPPDVRNCTTCHRDDRWKTEPNRLSCGACHDSTWFGPVAEAPADTVPHVGGPQANDALCSACHQPDGLSPAISAVHAPPEIERDNTITLTMSAPANGAYYTAGEAPVLTIAFADAATGVTVNPNTIDTDTWSRVRLQVSGPRDHTVPVLTSAAADHSLSGSSSYVYVDLRVGADHVDPMISRSATSISYQLADVAGLEPGTYTVFVQSRANERPSSSVGLINFQIGESQEELNIATNCVDCHGDTNMHGSYPFSLAPDLCKSCHDYERQLDGRSGWNDSNNGYGAAPLSRRVHGVHFGHYLDKPEEIHGEADAEHFAGIIFPQDIRNCQKCHSANTADHWIAEPSRLACNACHDSDAALIHASLMTQDPTPDEPFSGDEVETCVTCHGEGKDFSADKVHNISDPYVPPYPRDPAGGE